MTRSWFKCECCGRECDNSVRAPENAPGEPNRFIEICQPCADSYCAVCDSLYPEPDKKPGLGYVTTCEECGNPGYFNKATAQNIKELNAQTRKNTIEQPHH